MDNDDDVEHLFSWLQAPELRYREFAGAREITDTVVAWQARPPPAEPAPADEPPDAANGEGLFDDEYPGDSSLDDTDAALDDIAPQIEAEADKQSVQPMPQPVIRGSALFASAPMPSEPSAAPDAGPFALGAAGRIAQRVPEAEEEPLVPPPLIQTPGPRLAPAPATPIRMPTAPAAVSPPPAPAAVSPPPAPAAPIAGGGLLGGAYRENGANGHAVNGDTNGEAAAEPTAPLDRQKSDARSLDAVFGRLSGTRDRPNLRERLHIPGFGPADGRPR